MVREDMMTINEAGAVNLSRLPNKVTEVVHCDCRLLDFM